MPRASPLDRLGRGVARLARAAATVEGVVLVVIGCAGVSCDKGEAPAPPPRSRVNEVVADFHQDVIVVSVPYPGATPGEVEDRVTLVVEEQLRAIDAVKQLSSTSKSGRAVITAELHSGADVDRALADITSAVGRITTFPERVESPIISRRSTRPKP